MNVMLIKELKQLLDKYPDDIRVVIGVEPNNDVGFYYNLQCGGIDTGNEKLFYVASKDLSEDIEIMKAGEWLE